MSFPLVGSLPHPPFRIPQLIPRLCPSTRNIGHFFKIFVLQTITFLCPHLQKRLNFSCFITFMSGLFPLYPLFCRLFLIFIADRICLPQRLQELLLDLCKARSAFLDLLCLLYTSPSPRDKRQSRMPSSA